MDDGIPPTNETFLELMVIRDDAVPNQIRNTEYLSYMNNVNKLT